MCFFGSVKKPKELLSLSVCWSFTKFNQGLSIIISLSQALRLSSLHFGLGFITETPCIYYLLTPCKNINYYLAAFLPHSPCKPNYCSIFGNATIQNKPVIYTFWSQVCFRSLQALSLSQHSQLTAQDRLSQNTASCFFGSSNCIIIFSATREGLIKECDISLSYRGKATPGETKILFEVF